MHGLKFMKTLILEPRTQENRKSSKVLFFIRFEDSLFLTFSSTLKLPLKNQRQLLQFMQIKQKEG